MDVILPGVAMGCCVCCALSVAKFEDVPLSKGTQYWLVIGTDANSGNTEAYWYFTGTDIRAHPYALNKGAGWEPVKGVVYGVKILGK